MIILCHNRTIDKKYLSFCFHWIKSCVIKTLKHLFDFEKILIEEKQTFPGFWILIHTLDMHSLQLLISSNSTCRNCTLASQTFYQNYFLWCLEKNNSTRELQDFKTSEYVHNLYKTLAFFHQVPRGTILKTWQQRHFETSSKGASREGRITRRSRISRVSPPILFSALPNPTSIALLFMWLQILQMFYKLTNIEPRTHIVVFIYSLFTNLNSINNN